MPDVSQFENYARLLRLSPVNQTEVTLVEQRVPTSVRRRTWATKHATSFLVLVVVPTFLILGYFWLLSAPRYESEARFILRVPGRVMLPTQLTQMASLLQDAGVSRSNDDGYIIKEYLESRDALAYLEKHEHVKKALSAARDDPFWKYPSRFFSNTEEGFYKYYKRIISVTFDNTTGVGILKLQAFSPEDAQRLSEALLGAAEQVVNRLNDRSRQDASALAEAETVRARQRVATAQEALTKFRERERLVDPKQATLALFEAIGQLGLEVAKVSVQLNELGQSSPKSPQIAALRTKRAALESQITIERNRLAGDSLSIAPRIAEYERLMLDREFADKALIAAMSSVEMARIEANRKQIYLERVAQPAKPDYPTYPWRILWSIAAIVCSFMAWKIWRVLAADAKRHAE